MAFFITLDYLDKTQMDFYAFKISIHIFLLALIPIAYDNGRKLPDI
jgi:hypothetical protein